jgi:hypothetical protein
MSTQQTVYRAGDRIPELGVYECDGPVEKVFNAETLGEFPPPPEGCNGWRLVKRGPIGPSGFTEDDVPGAPS